MATPAPSIAASPALSLAASPCDGVVAMPLAASPSDRLAAAPSTSTSTSSLMPHLGMIGRTIGNYRILRFIGKGGMAAVYIAKHQSLGHLVAIKLLHERHLASVTTLRRFANEARTMARIRHPGLVQIHDIGRHTDGRPYVIMELLEGETLSQRLYRGPLDEAHIIAFSRQIASALAAAHEREVIHRDIKPGNVFLTSDPELPLGMRAKVLDFGVAKTPTPFDASITATGMLVGTPAYMSPEQCRGDDALDARSDVYALGLLMYRMATGQAPFEAGPDIEMIRNQLYVTPPSPRALGAAISPELDGVIATCIEKEPAHRFSSMQALIARLKKIEAGHRADERTTAPMTAPLAPAAPAVALADASDDSQPAASAKAGAPQPALVAAAATCTRPAAPDAIADEITAPTHFYPPRRLLWSALGGVLGAAGLIAALTELGVL